MLFACVCLMAFAPAWGETIRVAVPPLANLLERDDSGVYQRLVGRALEPLDYSIEQVFYPYRRSFKAFEQGRVDCLFSLGAILKRRLGAERIVQSYPPPSTRCCRISTGSTAITRSAIATLSGICPQSSKSSRKRVGTGKRQGISTCHSDRYRPRE